LRVALCFPCPLDPRDDPPALGSGVSADQPGSGLCLQASGVRGSGLGSGFEVLGLGFGV
jgi:hypothetical protein